MTAPLLIDKLITTVTSDTVIQNGSKLSVYQTVSSVWIRYLLHFLQINEEQNIFAINIMEHNYRQIQQNIIINFKLKQNHQSIHRSKHHTNTKALNKIYIILFISKHTSNTNRRIHSSNIKAFNKMNIYMYAFIKTSTNAYKNVYQGTLQFTHYTFINAYNKTYG